MTQYTGPKYPQTCYREIMAVTLPALDRHSIAVTINGEKTFHSGTLVYQLEYNGLITLVFARHPLTREPDK